MRLGRKADFLLLGCVYQKLKLGRSGGEVRLAGLHHHRTDHGLFKLGETDWHETAFRTVVASLAKITAQSQRGA
jgi:hypothetical protein